MMMSATPLNVEAPARTPHPVSPPFGSGGSAVPTSRESSTSWQTVGGGMRSPLPGAAAEGEGDVDGDAAAAATPKGQGGWLVSLVEKGTMPSLSGLTGGLTASALAASAASWAGAVGLPVVRHLEAARAGGAGARAAAGGGVL